MATVVHLDSGRVTASFAAVAKHCGVAVRPCPRPHRVAPSARCHRAPGWRDGVLNRPSQGTWSSTGPGGSAGAKLAASSVLPLPS